MARSTRRVFLLGSRGRSRRPPRGPCRSLCRPARGRCRRRPPTGRRRVGNRLAARGRAAGAAGCPTHRPGHGFSSSARRGCARGPRRRRGFFSAARRLGVGPHDGRIEHDPVQIRLLHRLKQALPDAFLRPAPTALAHRIVPAEASGKRPPSAPVARNPEHGVQKEPVINAGSPHVACFSRQMRRQSCPRTVTNLINIAHQHKGNCPYNLGQ
jgi:hypothetical protein